MQRRTFLERTAAVLLSSTIAGSLLEACGGSSSSTGTTTGTNATGSATPGGNHDRGGPNTGPPSANATPTPNSEKWRTMTREEQSRYLNETISQGADSFAQSVVNQAYKRGITIATDMMAPAVLPIDASTMYPSMPVGRYGFAYTGVLGTEGKIDEASVHYVLATEVAGKNDDNLDHTVWQTELKKQGSANWTVNITTPSDDKGGIKTESFDTYHPEQFDYGDVQRILQAMNDIFHGAVQTPPVPVGHFPSSVYLT